MGAIKWFAGIWGWVSGGPIGALLWYFIGSMVESGIDSLLGGTADNSSSSSQTYQRTSGRTGGYSATEQRNSFIISLLVLSSAVIKADGKTHPSELEYVKSFIRQNFGEAAVGDAMTILNQLNSQNIDIYSVGGQIASYMNYSQRMQLFHYLVGIANADGDFCKEEKSVLEAIASAIRLNSSDADSIIAMYYKDTDSAYAVLEITPSATDEEVKLAYRRMAMKNHPDKVATLGPEVQKAAEEKFRKIQEAYETIKKQRGIA
ncbi:MAG: TerB family tellurite resistance protein [Bacteroidales bacterium]|nr:TerB family tellurite resistance protein [Bacteroidales bacterium]